MNASSRHAARRPAPADGRSTSPAAAAPDTDRLADLLTPVAAALGLDLDGVRITSAGRRRLLRVIVDADGGVSLDQIALASRELSAELDDTGAMGASPYTLEVSSPGVDRPLREPRHWRRAVGRLVLVPLAAPGSARPGAEPGAGGLAAGAVIEGRVVGATSEAVTLDVAGSRREFGYADLGAGRIQVEFARLGDPDLGDDDEADENDEDAAAEEPDGH